MLYRFYNSSGVLLYVGVTNDPPRRFGDHRKAKEWWSEVARINLEMFAGRDELLRAEIEAIKIEHPLYNLTYNTENAQRVRCPNCGCSLTVMMTGAAEPESSLGPFPGRCVEF